MTLLDLEPLITQAEGRRKAQQQAYAEEEAKRDAEALAHFRERLLDLFGADLLDTLRAEVEAPADFERAPNSVALIFRNREYRLRDTRYGWSLKRRDAHLPAEHWPNIDVYATYSYTIEQRRDNLLLALADLDGVPVSAPMAPREEIAPAPEPASQLHPTEEHLLAALRDYVRDLASGVFYEQA